MPHFADATWRGPRMLARPSANVEWWQPSPALESSSLVPADFSSLARGLCGVTLTGGCENTTQLASGSWAGLPSLSECEARCRGCTRCHFVSFSRRTNDCSWYHDCLEGQFITLHLRNQAYRTRHVRAAPPALPPPPTSLRKTTTLVVVLNEVRAGQLTWRRFARYLLRPLSAEFALCVSASDARRASQEQGGTGPRGAFYRRARYVWKMPEFEDWAEGFDEVRRLSSVKPNTRTHHHTQPRDLAFARMTCIAGAALAGAPPLRYARRAGLALCGCARENAGGECISCGDGQRSGFGSRDSTQVLGCASRGQRPLAWRSTRHGARIRRNSALRALVSCPAAQAAGSRRGVRAVCRDAVGPSVVHAAPAARQIPPLGRGEGP